MDLLVIIPAYNEELNIKKVLEDIHSTGLEEYGDLLILNDASEDNTGSLVKSMGITTMDNIYNMGYGSSLQVGYKYAIRHGYQYVIQMDADGQHDPSNVTRIYEKLITEEAGHKPDIVIGSRFVEGAPEYQFPCTKKIAFFFFRYMIHLMTGQKITDPTSGLQGLSRECFQYYSKFSHFDDKYPDANMLVQMSLLGYQIVEIPAVMHLRSEGKSMHSGILRPMIYMFRMGFSLIAAWMRIRLFHVDRKVHE